MTYLFFGPELDDRNPRSEPGRTQRVAAAKAVCARCPVLHQCREWALQTKQPFGISGGMTERQRRAEWKRRTRQEDR